MSFKEGSKFPAGVEFSYIPIQLDDLELINPLKCDVASQLKLDNLLTKLSTTDTPNLLIVSVPGAFTPTCTESHLPPYLENLAKLHDKKIGAIVVLATNDQFVVNAWGKVLIKAYVKYGLAGDRGGIIRNKRYAAVIDSKTKDVVYLGVETEKGVQSSGIDAVLAKL